MAPPRPSARRHRGGSGSSASLHLATDRRHSKTPSARSQDLSSSRSLAAVHSGVSGAAAADSVARLQGGAAQRGRDASPDDAPARAVSAPIAAAPVRRPACPPLDLLAAAPLPPPPAAQQQERSALNSRDIFDPFNDRATAPAAPEAAAPSSPAAAGGAQPVTDAAREAALSPPATARQPAVSTVRAYAETANLQPFNPFAAGARTHHVGPQPLREGLQHVAAPRSTMPGLGSTLELSDASKVLPSGLLGAPRHPDAPYAPGPAPPHMHLAAPQSWAQPHAVPHLAPPPPSWHGYAPLHHHGGWHGHPASAAYAAPFPAPGPHAAASLPAHAAQAWSHGGGHPAAYAAGASGGGDPYQQAPPGSIYGAVPHHAGARVPFAQHEGVGMAGSAGAHARAYGGRAAAHEAPLPARVGLSASSNPFL